MSKTRISWTDTTWNPVVGCSHAGSPGCDACYAARMAKRQAGMARAKRAEGQDPGRSAHYEKVENWDGVALVPEALGDPLRWRKPRRVFVCSMADLFHEDVPYFFARDVWRVMHRTRRHTFQILTKRPDRMLNFVSHLAVDIRDGTPQLFAEQEIPQSYRYLATNVHLGVTAEDQQRADERIPILLQTPAALHYVSFEPLLSEIVIPSHWFAKDNPGGPQPNGEYRIPSRRRGISLAIVGGETGPGARPMHPAWARSLRDQCAAAGVGFHFKSWGEWVEFSSEDHGDIEPRQAPSGEINNFAYLTESGQRGPLWKNATTMIRVGANAGHLLDGVEHRDLGDVTRGEMPE